MIENIKVGDIIEIYGLRAWHRAIVKNVNLDEFKISYLYENEQYLMRVPNIHTIHYSFIINRIRLLELGS